MAAVFIGVGSNIDPMDNISQALRLLSKCVTIHGVSTFCETEPIDSPGAPRFVNGVIRVDTFIRPRKLKFNVLRWLEASMGRERGLDKNKPRPIDLDILLYGSLFLQEPDLVLPDPHIRERAFLAIGICELSPGLRLPDNGEPISNIAGRLADGRGRNMMDFTQRLRRELCFGSTEDTGTCS